MDTVEGRCLALRTLALALLLGCEAMAGSLLLDGASLAASDGLLTGWIRNYGAWAVKGCIGFAALFTTFAYLRYRPALISVSRRLALTPLRPSYFAAHGAAFVCFGALSVVFYGHRLITLPADYIALTWMAAGVGAVALAGLALAPATLWLALLQATGRLWLVALAAAAAACLAGASSWRLWRPATQLTFRLVQFILHPLLRDMVVRPASMIIGTHRFTAIISPECSGLEGTALMLIFGALWLILFRDEIHFPQALALVPAGVAMLFLMNAVRIAALILIGNTGAREVAARGFHSQAGWIAFNCVALAFSVVARRVSWFSARPEGGPRPAAEMEYPAAPYLVPVLAILAASMFSRAATGSFEWTYPLRLAAALAALWMFRRAYAAMDWKFGWRGPAMGAVVFALWIGLDRWSGGPPTGMPVALAAAPPALRVAWITVRVVAAAVTVPVAEELAFRGFLLRRLVAPDFEAVSFKVLAVFPVLVSSLLFGLLHGDRWVAGTLAGILYAVALHRGRGLGEAVAAHATTNALLAAYVLVFQKWSLW